MMKNIRGILLVALIVCVITPAVKAADRGADPIMRVLVIDDKQSIGLRMFGKYTITSSETKQVLMRGWSLNTRMRATRDGFQIGSKDLRSAGVKIRAEGNDDMAVDGRYFRGDVEVLHKPNGRLMVINYVDLDGYLFGVLSHEVSHRWPVECLKAQAIAARTFAFYQARINALQPFDLRSDIYSQVYGGKNNEQLATTAAVQSTSGKVLTYNGAIFPAYFHATCAGFTEDSSNLWSGDIPPLDGGRCEYCKDSKHFFWRCAIPLDDVADALRQNGYRIGEIRSVRVLSKNKSGRVDKLEIGDNTGVSVVMTGKVFRQLFGPNKVRSTKFNASVRMDMLILDGLGWGHGVGMCQWGAYGMARVGKTAEQILRQYYPGADITPLETLPPKS